MAVAAGPAHLMDEDTEKGFPQLTGRFFSQFLREMHESSDTVKADDIGMLRDLFARSLAKAQQLPSNSIFVRALDPSELPR